jgi:hypothetical protein
MNLPLSDRSGVIAVGGVASELAKPGHVKAALLSASENKEDSDSKKLRFTDDGELYKALESRMGTKLRDLAQVLFANGEAAWFGAGVLTLSRAFRVNGDSRSRLFFSLIRC